MCVFGGQTEKPGAYLHNCVEANDKIAHLSSDSVSPVEIQALHADKALWYVGDSREAVDDYGGDNRRDVYVLIHLSDQFNAHAILVSLRLTLGPRSTAERTI
jgi:hypothetical protein